MTGGIALDEDFHVHSTFSDGASTLAQNVRAARQRGLRTLALVDHVRRDTDWVPRFAAEVAALRGPAGPHILAGVEAKILDRGGRLDLPELPAGIDLVLVADHQFPGEHGPDGPEVVRARLAAGHGGPAETVEELAEATASALAQAPARPQLAHLFSLLPKIGLDESAAPDSLVAMLAGRARRAGAQLEVNEKWACPSARVVRIFADAGVRIVASTDSHDHRDVGVYSAVRQTAERATASLMR